MRFLRPTVVVALVLAAYGVAQGVLSAQELQQITPTTTRPNLPTSQLLAAAGFALSLGAYGALGRLIVRAGATPGAAALRGALAGLASGVLSGVAQAVLTRDFVAQVAAAYGLPETFSTALLVATIVVSPLVGAGVGALLTWLAALLFRPRTPEELV